MPAAGSPAHRCRQLGPARSPDRPRWRPALSTPDRRRDRAGDGRRSGREPARAREARRLAVDAPALHRLRQADRCRQPMRRPASHRRGSSAGGPGDGCASASSRRRVGAAGAVANRRPTSITSSPSRPAAPTRSATSGRPALAATGAGADAARYCVGDVAGEHRGCATWVRFDWFSCVSPGGRDTGWIRASHAMRLAWTRSHPRCYVSRSCGDRREAREARDGAHPP